ncbi:GNAT family N-acetyltransferase [bacterium]|nr:GNAT family N-acetyltransferase [bacterium]
MIREVRREERDELLSLLKSAFPGTEIEWFPPYYDGDPYYKFEYTRVWEENGKLVSTVQIVKKILRIEDQTILLGGIANVGTHPDHRGRGYATALLEDSIRIMREEGFHLSLLFTGIQPFYERLGWREVPFPFLHISTIPTDIPPQQNIRDYNDDDIPDIVRIYNEFNDKRNLSVVRDEAYMRGWIWKWRHHQEVLIYEEDSRPVGYIRFSKGRTAEPFWINEFGCLKGREDCFVPLLSEAIRRASENAPSSCTIHLPLEDFIIQGIKTVMGEPQLQFGKGAMWRLINLPALLSAISPVLSRRSEGLKGVLPLDIEGHTATLKLDNGRVSVEDSLPASPPPIHLSQKLFVNLLAGFEDEEAKTLPVELRKLFPPAKPIFYSFDTF